MQIAESVTLRKERSFLVGAAASPPLLFLLRIFPPSCTLHKLKFTGAGGGMWKKSRAGICVSELWMRLKSFNSGAWAVAGLEAAEKRERKTKQRSWAGLCVWEREKRALILRICAESTLLFAVSRQTCHFGWRSGQKFNYLIITFLSKLVAIPGAKGNYASNNSSVSYAGF
jgi:hypothetical protein